jgi:hypothetical protein
MFNDFYTTLSYIFKEIKPRSESRSEQNIYRSESGTLIVRSVIFLRSHFRKQLYVIALLYKNACRLSLFNQYKSLKKQGLATILARKKVWL